MLSVSVQDSLEYNARHIARKSNKQFAKAKRVSRCSGREGLANFELLAYPAHE
jgi:hypothetical protein